MADTKVGDLTERTSLQTGDRFYVISDPSGVRSGQQVLASSVNVNNDQTEMESIYSVTPVDKSFPQGFIERYGGGITTDSTAALVLATSVGRQNVYFATVGRTGTLNDFSTAYFFKDAFVNGNSLIGPANFTADGTQNISILRLGRDPDFSNGFQWRQRRIQDITFLGNLRAHVAITFGDDAGAVDQYALGWTLDGLTFERCHIGIYKEQGNFGNRIVDCSSNSGNYGYVAIGRPSTGISHIGNDKIEGGEWSGHRKYAFYLDGKNVGGTGDTYFRNVIIEDNQGGGIFVKDYNNAYTPLRLDNVWFENNQTAGGTVDLSDVGGPAVHTPRDIYLENVDHCIVTGSQLREIEVKDSNLICEFCSLESGGAKFYDSSVGANSIIRMRNVHITNWGDELIGAGLVTIESLDRVSSQGGASSNRMWIAPPRKPYSGTGIQRGRLLESTTFQEGNDFQAVATTDIPRDGYVEGLTFPTASQYTFTPGDSFIGPSESAAVTTNGKWYVCTIEARLDSGGDNLQTFRFGSGYNHTRGDSEELLKANAGEWVTLANVSELVVGSGTIRPFITTGAGSNVQMSFGAMQIVEFDKAQDAYDYYNSGYFALNNGKAERVIQSDVARPTQPLTAVDPYLSGWPLDPDTVYVVQGCLILDTDAVANFKFGMDFSQVPQIVNVGANSYTDAGDADKTVQISTAEVTLVGNPNLQIVQVDGMFKTNATTGGIVDFKWGQGTSDVYSTTLQEGSWLRIHKAYNPS